MLSIPFVGIFLLHPRYSSPVVPNTRLRFQFPLLGFSYCIHLGSGRCGSRRSTFNSLCWDFLIASPNRLQETVGWLSSFQFPLLGFSYCIRWVFGAFWPRGSLFWAAWEPFFDYLLVAICFIKIIEKWSGLVSFGFF